MTDDLAVRVEQACQQLLTAGAEVTFGEVATRVGIGRATLYRRPELRAIVEEHRQRGGTHSPSPACRSRSTSSAQPWKPSQPTPADTKKNSDDSNAATDPADAHSQRSPLTQD